MKNETMTYEEMEKNAYCSCRNSIVEARRKVYAAVNSAMVMAYWEIGKTIYEACGENDRAAYGEKLLDNISKKLTAEFGKGFTVANLRNMRQFYTVFQKRYTLCSELSWSHYRLLMRIENQEKRDFYVKECVEAGWSVRQLERQTNTLYYDRLLASKDKKSVAKEIQSLDPKH